MADAVQSRLVQGPAYAMLCVIWGSTWLAIKIGLGGAPPFLAAGLRFALASVVLLAAVSLLRSKLPRTRTEWALVGYFGIVLFTADYGLIYWGEGNGVESGLSAILFATFPFQTALFAHFLISDDRLSARKAAGVAVGFGGVLLVFRGQLEAAGLPKLFPMLAVVLAATCASTATVALKRWGHETDPVSFNALSMGVGALGLAAVSAGAGEAWAVPSWPEGILAILYLGLAGSVVAFVAYMWLLRRLPVTTMSYVILVTPIVAVFLGVAVGNEVFDPLALVGATVTLGGIYLSTSKRAAARGRGSMGPGVIPDPAPADPPRPKD
ncbi:MAG: DMT family transporter [Methanobacteriota archaeon]